MFDEMTFVLVGNHTKHISHVQKADGSSCILPKSVRILHSCFIADTGAKEPVMVGIARTKKSSPLEGSSRKTFSRRTRLYPRHETPPLWANPRRLKGCQVSRRRFPKPEENQDQHRRQNHRKSSQRFILHPVIILNHSVGQPV
jgi:hypothetical protein